LCTRRLPGLTAFSGFAGHDGATARRHNLVFVGTHADGFIWLRQARRRDGTTTRPSFGKKA
jgi:hypothetical protein